MPTKKVNAKTKILEFKKKHNLLVEEVDEISASAQTETDVKQLILDDKNVINQLNYGGEGEDFLEFPEFILPLRIQANSGDIYFMDYSRNKMIDEDLNDVCEFEFNENKLRILDWNDQTAASVYNLEYILFDGEDEELILNTYYLYHPITSGGTKLYLHKLTGFTVYQGSNLYFVSTDNTNLSGKTIEQICDYLLYHTILVYYVLGGGASNPVHFNDLIYTWVTVDGTRGVKLYSIEFDIDNGHVVLTSSPNIITGTQVLNTVQITDTVTEL